MLIPVSYTLKKDTPLYPNIPAPEIRSHRSIEYGDSANTSLITLSNHTGTHVDLPLHFCRHGNSVSDMFSHETIFSPVYCIDIQKKPGEPVVNENFLSFFPRIKDAEALLVRTGMFRFRGKSVYLFGYPRIAESVPDFLRQQLLHLKLFGTDTLSISNPSYREQGRECHRRFLCIDPPIVIMEDMDLSSDCLARGTWRLRVYPLILDALDAVPVVALAESASSKVMKEYK